MPSQSARDQRRLARQRKRRLDRGLDSLGRQVQLALGLVELLAKALQLLLKPPLEGQHPLDRLGLALGIPRVERARAHAEHGLLDLLGDHRADLAEVLADRLHLVHGPGEELEIAVEVARAPAFQVLSVEAGRDEVEDLHLIGALAVAIDAAVALLEPVRVPGDLVVDQLRAVVLEVDALGRRIGGEQDANVGLIRPGLEGGLDLLALVLRHAAEQEEQSVVASEAARGEQLEQPLLGRAVLGEDDDALVGPFAVRPDIGL